MPRQGCVPERRVGGRRAQIFAGISDSFWAGLGIFPFGIALGLLVMQLGLPWWLAPALSLSAFAGSLELLLVGMIATVEPPAAVAVTVFVVNFRHVFYAFSFPRHLVRNRFARLYATYAMIDEVYAVGNKLCLADMPYPADNILLALKFSNGATGKVQITGGCRRPDSWSPIRFGCSMNATWRHWSALSEWLL